MSEPYSRGHLDVGRGAVLYLKVSLATCRIKFIAHGAVLIRQRRQTHSSELVSFYSTELGNFYPQSSVALVVDCNFLRALLFDRMAQYSGVGCTSGVCNVCGKILKSSAPEAMVRFHTFNTILPYLRFAFA